MGEFAGGVPFGGAGLFPGLGGGFSKNIELDGGAGAGIPGGGIGGFPGGVGSPGGFAGWGGPYVPVTPLGALGGIKGDLLIPIVVVGMAAFLLLVIVLAVKAALSWKMQMLNDVAGGGPRFARDASEAGTVDQTEVDRITTLFYNALTQNCWTQRMLCEVGKMGKDYVPMIEMVKVVTPQSMIPVLDVVKDSAQSEEKCEHKFPCQTMPTSKDDALNKEHQNGMEHHNNTLTKRDNYS